MLSDFLKKIINEEVRIYKFSNELSRFVQFLNIE